MFLFYIFIFFQILRFAQDDRDAQDDGEMSSHAHRARRSSLLLQGLCQADR